MAGHLSRSRAGDLRKITDHPPDAPRREAEALWMRFPRAPLPECCRHAECTTRLRWPGKRVKQIIITVIS
jgi:hypothetical protein